MAESPRLRSIVASSTEARVRELEEQLALERAVCICGCEQGIHESYGEDGESCGVPGHECMRVAPAVRTMYQRALAAGRWEALKETQRAMALRGEREAALDTRPLLEDVLARSPVFWVGALTLGAAAVAGVLGGAALAGNVAIVVPGVALVLAAARRLR